MGAFTILFGQMWLEEGLFGWLIEREEFFFCDKWFSPMDNYENVQSVSFGKGKPESRGRLAKVCVVEGGTCWTKFNNKGFQFIVALEVCGDVVFIWKN